MFLGHGELFVEEVLTRLSRRTLTSVTRSEALKREIEDLEKEMIAGRDTTIERLGFENADDRARNAA